MDESTQQPVAPITPSEETLLAEWQEATHPLPELSGKTLSLLILGGSVLAAASIGLAIWFHEFNLYFVAVVLILAVSTLIVQNRKPTASLKVTITNVRLMVGNRQYLMEDLAGFWLQSDRETVVINVEPKKASMVPITFLFAENNTEAARQTMLAIMPELESRLPNATDRINRYFRF